MKTRQEFETIFPLPEGVEWEEELEMYTADSYDFDYEAYAYNYMFKLWKFSPITSRTEIVQKIEDLEKYYDHLCREADFRDKEYFSAVSCGLRMARKILQNVEDQSTVIDYDDVYDEVD